MRNYRQVVAYTNLFCVWYSGRLSCERRNLTESKTSMFIISLFAPPLPFQWSNLHFVSSIKTQKIWIIDISRWLRASYLGLQGWKPAADLVTHREKGNGRLSWELSYMYSTPCSSPGEAFVKTLNRRSFDLWIPRRNWRSSRRWVLMIGTCMIGCYYAREKTTLHLDPKTC